MSDQDARLVNGPIRILAVDSSLASRRVMTGALAGDDRLEVAATASNAATALKRALQTDPDVVVLGTAMPDSDRIANELRALNPRIRIIPFDASCGDGRACAELPERIRGLFAFTALRANHRDLAASADAELAKRPFPYRRRVVAIGVSTGGPNALATIMPMFPADFSLPVLIVQHMPASFTTLLAERLAAHCAIPVEEARHGSVIEPGKILLAPGDFHMRARSLPDGQVVAALDQGHLENSCRPSVDALFRSVAEVYGAASIGIVLTGMGQDGAAGAALLKSRGAYIIAQDEPSSVVWGMPGAVVNSGVADAVVDLNSVVPEILKQTFPRQT